MSNTLPLRFALALALACAAVGCKSVSAIKDVPMESDFDEKAVFDGSYDSSLKPIQVALEKVGMKVVEVNEVDKNRRVVYAELPSKFWALVGGWGQWVRITVTRLPAQQLEVRIYNTRKIDMNRTEDLPGTRRRLLLEMQTAFAQAEAS